MSVADSTDRLISIPAGTPRARRMPVTGTRAPRRVGGATVVRSSRRHSEVNATAARARREERERAAAGHVGAAHESARGDGADELAESGTDGEVAEVAVLFVRRGPAGHQ